MKYVIKRINAHQQYVRSVDYRGMFEDTAALDEARQFNTLFEAIEVLRIRVKETPSLVYDQFTIVGIKEINQPRYEEVVL